MSELRREVIHAAMEAGDHHVVEHLMGAVSVPWTKLCGYARHYGL